MKSILKILLIPVVLSLGCKEKQKQVQSEVKKQVPDVRVVSGEMAIAEGQMPNVANDNNDHLYVVFGSGDRIMYTSSSDNGGTFSSPELIAVLHGLAASHMRGPQIASTADGMIVLACNEAGNIFSYKRDNSGKWLPPVKVNDVDATAKENLMALGADGQNAFAVWVDGRNKLNRIYGSKSGDGGKTWSKNIMIYTSPDKTVCECCKPSVAVKNNNVYVMFRNFLDGNRDLYLSRSSDGGNSFVNAEKLGNGSWPLEGCPMDGGSITINRNGEAETVWRRQNKIFACEPGKPEKEIGEGKSCSLASVNNKNIYAWTENGKIVTLLPDGQTESLGKGTLPVVKEIGRDQVICVWQNGNQIKRSILQL